MQRARPVALQLRYCLTTSLFATKQAGQILDRAKLKLAGRKKVVAEAKQRRAQMPACGAGIWGHIPSAEECESKCDPYKLIDSKFITCFLYLCLSCLLSNCLLGCVG